MAQHKPAKSKPRLDYPDETEGSRIAAQVRKAASKLTAEQRREHFNAGMAMIYGGANAGKTALPRR